MKLNRVFALVMFLVSARCAWASAPGNAPDISSIEYRSLEPYCGVPAVAERFLSLEQEFNVGVSWREEQRDRLANREEAVARSGQAAYDTSMKEATDAIAQSAREYVAIRTDVIASLADMKIDEPLLRATAHDVLVLSWRLSATERHLLLVDAMAVQPAVETVVVEAIQRCIAEEAREVLSAMPEGQDKAALVNILGAAAPGLLTRASIESRIGSVAAAIWTPDPALRALDARELVTAWLAMPEKEGRMPLHDRCYRLLTMSKACVTPKMVPGTSAIYRYLGQPLLVAPDAIFLAIEASAERLGENRESVVERLESNRGDFAQTDAIGGVLGRVSNLEQVVDRQGVLIAKLSAGLKAVNDRVDAVEARVKTLEDWQKEMEAWKKAIDAFLKNELSTEQTKRLLEQVAPILKHDEWQAGPLMRPSDFAKGCGFLADKDDAAHIRNKRFDAKSLRELLDNKDNEALSRAWEMIPYDLRKNGLGAPARTMPGEQIRAMNVAAVKSGDAVFGAVRSLAGTSGEQDHTWSVKYFFFHAWNETDFIDGEGNHEGDWGCVDLTVRVPYTPSVGPDIAKADVIDAIIHEHGRPHRFGRSDLTIENGRLIVYLEKGTNEAHPKPGGAAQKKKALGLATVGHVIRSHRGGGYELDVKQHPVKNVFDSAEYKNNTDVQLIRHYHGQWGEYDDDDFKWASGIDTTNPRGPLDNPKFRDRVGVIDHRHKH